MMRKLNIIKPPFEIPECENSNGIFCYSDINALRPRPTISSGKRGEGGVWGGLRGSNEIKETPHNDNKTSLLRYSHCSFPNAYDTTFYPLMQYRTSPLAISGIF